jgi:hypothetical protein
LDVSDNCPTIPNDQTDTDIDGLGDACDLCANDPDNDVDGDGICGDVDTCPNDPHNDLDGDGICGDVDNCPLVPNDGQEDIDFDGVGDACDNCPDDVDNDSDKDGICNGLGFYPPKIGGNDNCQEVSNPDQSNIDGDLLGDACDDTAMGQDPDENPPGEWVPAHLNGELFLDVTVTLSPVDWDGFPGLDDTTYAIPTQYNVVPELSVNPEIPADTIHCGPPITISEDSDDLVLVTAAGGPQDHSVRFPLSRWWSKLEPGTTYSANVRYVNHLKDLGPSQEIPEEPEFEDIWVGQQTLETGDIPVGEEVGDQCPDDGIDLGQGILGTGCDNAVDNSLVMHTIYIGKAPAGGKPSSEEPISGGGVHLFDRNNSNFKALFGNKLNGADYPLIYRTITSEEDGFLGACITDDNGECPVGVDETGSCLAIAQYYDAETGKTVYVGLPMDPSNFVEGIAEKAFQVMKAIKKDGTVIFRGGSKIAVTGSLLEIISPQSGIWEGTKTLYPFIFTSDSDWTVDLCAEVPSGYRIVGVYDENGDLIPSAECVQTFVSGETKTVAFEVEDVGLQEPWLGATLDIVSPKGKKVKKKVKAYDIRKKTFYKKLKELKAKKKNK